MSVFVEKVIVAIFLIVLFSTTCMASEPSTFTYFYSESASVNWGLVIVATIAIGLAVYTGFATAPAAVTSIGTLIGNATGLSGVAATNFGLALMGGGAMATGGAGVVVGTALLTSAMTFGTNIMSELAISAALEKYNYQSLVEKSRNLPTLPPPVRSDGSASYKAALKVLVAYKNDEPIKNQSLFREAIAVAENGVNGVKNEEEVQLRTLLSYLYFVTSQYKKSASQANTTIKLAKKLNLKWTLPAYIYSVSSMYDERPNFSSLNDNYFSYSVVTEPDNDFVPILFSQYMTHINLRFRGETSSYYRKVAEVANDKRVSEYSDQVLPLMLVNYFVNLKMEQQRIAVLSDSTNVTIKGSPITLADTEKSLNEYKVLLKDTRNTLNIYKIKPELSSAEKSLISAKVRLDKVQININQSLSSTINKQEARRARIEAEKLLIETKSSLNSVQSAIDQLFSDNVSQNELQQMRRDVGKMLNVSKDYLATSTQFISGKIDKEQMRAAQKDATKLLNDAKKSFEVTQSKINKFLNREKEKREQIHHFEKLLKDYESDVGRLEELINGLKAYQVQNKLQDSVKHEEISGFNQFLRLFQR